MWERAEYLIRDVSPPCPAARFRKSPAGILVAYLLMIRGRFSFSFPFYFIVLFNSYRYSLAIFRRRN